MRCAQCGQVTAWDETRARNYLCCTQCVPKLDRRIDVLETCADIHALVTGSVKASDAVIVALRDALQRRLDSWTPSKPKRRNYDEAMRALVRATVAEANRELKRRKGGA